MGAEIERIVDRKTVRNRVQYLVVWRGFGEESNTWESRMDLVADGYSDVIRAYENSRKDAESSGSASSSSASASTRSPSRGRSPGRTSSGAKSASKSPSRARGRPRSNSTGRSPSASRRRSSSKSKQTNGADAEPARRRSSRQTDKTLVADDKTAGDELLRKTLEALEQAPRTEAKAPASPTSSAPATASVQLAYEDVATVETTTQATPAATQAPASPAKAAKHVEQDAAGLQDLWQRLNEGNWLLWFLSVVVVAASLLASQLLPHAEGDDSDLAPGGRDIEAALTSQWRLWLPFLTPTVALLLVLNQRDERALVKWVAIALAWRIAAELSIFFEFAQVAIGAATVSYTALVVALVAIARSDDLRSKATLVVFTVGALTLALSDSWIVQTQNVALSSRVTLMSASALAIALSPVLTATSEED